MVSSVCGGSQVRSTKTSVSCLQLSMVVGVSWSGAAWVLPALGGTGDLQFIEETMNANMYCDILKQSRILSLWRLGHSAQRRFSSHVLLYISLSLTHSLTQGNIPTQLWPQTHLQDDHCLAKEAEGKGDGLAKHVSRTKPYWSSVGDPQMEGGGAQGLQHPPAPWCHHGGGEEDSSDNLWSSGDLHAQEG